MKNSTDIIKVALDSEFRKIYDGTLNSYLL